ncbi:MAG: hypothetical protein H6Q15_2405 [Bacteroidetes bacterium]|nr:hypothetical protein [Bacteroidota bacterium]
MNAPRNPLRNMHQPLAAKMTHKKYISIAKDDLFSAMILLKSKQYPQSLFYTDQAIEKLCKYVIIKDKILTEEQLKSKIGHDSTKVFDIITNYLIGKINESRENKYSDFVDDLITGKELLIKLRYKRKNDELSEEDINGELNIIKSYLFDNPPSPYDYLFIQKPEDLLNTLLDMNLIDKKEIPDFDLKILNNEFYNQILVLLKEYIEAAYKYQNYMMALISLAGLFSTHWETTRYPTQNLTPKDKYNENNLIIKYLQCFQDLTLELIMRFENLKI